MCVGTSMPDDSVTSESLNTDWDARSRNDAHQVSSGPEPGLESREPWHRSIPASKWGCRWKSPEQACGEHAVCTSRTQAFARDRCSVCIWYVRGYIHHYCESGWQQLLRWRKKAKGTLKGGPCLWTWFLPQVPPLLSSPCSVDLSHLLCCYKGHIL